ncbi:hypothetical protein QFZ37_002454 [Chryseobacterium ginsenosidimutans]|uniref:hypothetical protein n=1 Tax=Chryseobacterium ginsenosidimutans TaxID=687846 RepID=UPI002788C8C6|nr:hypothetical protein [Chryseobacterium ginsenosidimutans]MDQ0594085.1 hypothetical protein [Chryseobacterium ginsenosidimutans]
MKTKIALMAAVIAFSYASAQENPHTDSQLKNYSRKIDSIVVSEKIKMNQELDDVDKNFNNKKINIDEKQKQRAEIASKYELSINEKVDSQKSELEDATREMVKDAVLRPNDSLRNSKNQMMFGLGGIKIDMDTNKKTPKDYLHTIGYSIYLVGVGFTSKDKPFKFFDKDSDVKNTVFNSSSFVFRYENQLGGFKSPLFYRVGIGYRWDQSKPKYGRVFSQDNNMLTVKDFTKGNLKETHLDNHYIFVPVDFRFVLNPKYIEYEGVKYLDNQKSQFNLIAGVYGGFRVVSNIYNKYSNEFDNRIVERERLTHGVNDFVVGGKLGISYGGFNLYVQKDFTPTFNNNANLTHKYGLQIGIQIMNVNF